MNKKIVVYFTFMLGIVHCNAVVEKGAYLKKKIELATVLLEQQVLEIGKQIKALNTLGAVDLSIVTGAQYKTLTEAIKTGIIVGGISAGIYHPKQETKLGTVAEDFAAQDDEQIQAAKEAIDELKKS